MGALCERLLHTQLNGLLSYQTVITVRGSKVIVSYQPSEVCHCPINFSHQYTVTVCLQEILKRYTVAKHSCFVVLAAEIVPLPSTTVLIPVQFLLAMSSLVHGGY